MNTVTKAQVLKIKELQAERNLDLIWEAGMDQNGPEARSTAARVSLDVLRTMWREGKANVNGASTVIDFLLAAPKKHGQNTDDNAAYPAGIYEADGHLYRVYFGQTSGRMLVKSVEVDDGVTYIYLGAASRKLPADARRLTLDEVGELGKTFDHCLCCGRRLDDPESVDRGVGPVCARKYEVA